jgi:hypothetical protein
MGDCDFAEADGEDQPPTEPTAKEAGPGTLNRQTRPFFFFLFSSSFLPFPSLSLLSLYPLVKERPATLGLG